MQDLWKSVRAGDKKAFIELYDFFYQRLYAYGLKITGNAELTKECVQQLFMELWDRRQKLNDVNAVEPYLLKYLKRKLLKEIESERKKNSISSLHQVELSYEELLIENQTSEQNRKKLKAALNQLTAKQKQVIRMKFFEGLTYEEIAEINSTQVRTIYNQAFEALKILKTFLKTILPFTLFLPQ